MRRHSNRQHYALFIDFQTVSPACEPRRNHINLALTRSQDQVTCYRCLALLRFAATSPHSQLTEYKRAAALAS